MKCDTYGDAIAQAQRNAKAFNREYEVYQDRSGWHATTFYGPGRQSTLRKLPDHEVYGPDGSVRFVHRT